MYQKQKHERKDRDTFTSAKHGIKLTHPFVACSSLSSCSQSQALAVAAGHVPIQCQSFLGHDHGRGQHPRLASLSLPWEGLSCLKSF